MLLKTHLSDHIQGGSHVLMGGEFFLDGGELPLFSLDGGEKSQMPCVPPLSPIIGTPVVTMQQRIDTN